MPRIYSPVEDHTVDWGAVDFVNGVAALPAAANTAYFTAEGYTIDTSKHVLTVFDRMTVAALKEICAYTGVAVIPADTKATLIRKIEGYVSTHNITALTITSIAGTAVGDTNIVVAGNIGGAGKTLVYHVDAAAVAPLYKDVLPASWVTFASADDITATTGEFITVCEINAAREALSIGSAEVASKA